MPDSQREDTPTENRHKLASWKISAILCAVILVVAAGLATLTFLTEPTAKKGGATKKTAMLVEVVRVERGSYQPRIVAQGTVEPEQDVVLSPQVGGRVIALAPAFTPGGFVEEGEVLLRIEPADFEHALAQRKSELRQALSDQTIEQGRQGAAQAEYDYIDATLSPELEALVLRQPQLEAAEQQVGAARAAVKQAELNLRRTTVEAPFDAHIIRRNVNVGSQVSAGDDIGRLVGIETYWVAVELPLSKLRWVSIAGEGNQGSEVEVRDRQAWPKDAYRSGRLFRRIGALDEGTRMARVLASIPDPLARKADAQGQPPLMIGEFVEVSIRGKEIDNVIRLNRDYVRKNDTVWVMKDEKLHVNELEIVVSDANYAYVSGGLDDGAQIVTTNLATVVEGAPLRVQAPEEQANRE